MPMHARPRHTLTSRHHSPSAIWIALCLAALLAGCGQTAGAAPHARSTATTATTAPTVTATIAPATPTSVPLPPLTIIPSSGPPVAGITPSWRQANLPAGFGMAFHYADTGIFPSDGVIAYSCMGPYTGTSTNIHVVVTHDRGASWASTADPPGKWNGCQIMTVDSLNPSIVAVCCGLGTADVPFQEISTNGGASWRQVSLPHAATIQALATRGARTYAILVARDDSRQQMLAASGDGLRTWHAIDATLPTSGYSRLWVNPATGALLLESWPNGLTKELWSSDDDGAHWQQIIFPVPSREVVELTVRQPSVAAPWHICALYLDDAGGGIVCTGDGGRTWAQLPPLVDLPGSLSDVYEIVALPEDGSILVVGTTNSDPIRLLYRLPAGATRWQSLGPKPPKSTGGVAYAPTPDGNDALWTFPAESSGGGAPEPTGAVYSAPYPD
jgi:photosystem II stability/assembly factor-like uncharacterized protein